MSKLHSIFPALLLCAATSLQAATDTDAKIALLQAQIDALKPDYAYKVRFPGQYRVNFYSVDNDREDEDRQNAARLRLRQNIDIDFSDRLKSSLRLQLNHTNDNVTNAGDVNGNGVQVRHGYIEYGFADQSSYRLGLVPVEEYHHDLLYSKAWGYNPFALELFGTYGAFSAHAFAASLTENDETTQSDDTMHYQADLTYTPAADTAITLSATALDINKPDASGIHCNAALNIAYRPFAALHLQADVLYSHSDKALFALGKRAEGYAFLLKADVNYRGVNASVMATHASGDREGSGFLVPMSFTKTTSYWGYTGILTLLYQTDTGFAGDSLHVSNNGYGLSTLQTKVHYQPTHSTKLYLALGWFGNTNAPNRDSTVGIDGVLMGSYLFNRYLSLDLGIAHARLHDSLSGYSRTLNGESAFNQSEGMTRTKTALFGRLQLAF